MKKLLLLFCFALTLVACEGPEGPTGRDGLNGLNGIDGTNGTNGTNGTGTDWYVGHITITPDQWKLAGQPGELHSYYYVAVNVPKLDAAVYRSGAVIAYIKQPDNGKGSEKGVLPFVYHEGKENGDGTEDLWTATYDYNFYPGGMVFKVTYSDFFTQVSKPGEETFHIVLIW